MRTFAHPIGNDQRITSGESGAAGLGGLLALVGDPTLAAARERIHLEGSSRVLVINTEGDTDPEHYGQVISAPDGHN